MAFLNRIFGMKKPGMIEDVSIAVTLDSGSLPQGIAMEDLKDLVARSASPKANAKNVTIAFSDGTPPILAPDMPSQLPKPEASGNPWWTVAVLLAVGLLFGLIFIHQRAKREAERQQKEIDELLAKSEYHQNMLREAQEQANLVQEQLANLLAGNINLSIGVQDTIENIKENMEGLDKKNSQSN